METLANDAKAQTDGKAIAAVSLVVALLVVGLIGALLLPVAINEVTGNETVTINSSTSDEVEVNAVLNSTVTATTDGTNATIELNVSDGGSTTKTINQGSSATYSFDRGDVNVTVNQANSGSADVTYAHPKEFSFHDGARALWGILDIIIVLGLFLFVVGLALAKMRAFN